MQINLFSTDLYYYLNQILHPKNNLIFLRYPFNWKTPIGYMMIVFYQSVVTYLTASILFYSMLMTVAHCMFIVSFCTDVKNDIRMLNEFIKIESDKKKKFSAAAINKIKKMLKDIILFHVDTKELNKNRFHNHHLHIIILFLSIK